jgi:dienelactone hydrolase
MVNRLMAAGTSLNAGVAYYGQQLPAAEVPKITAPMMFHYGSLDTRIDAGIAAYEAALTANGKVFESYMCEGANHAFNNNTNPSRYNSRRRPSWRGRGQSRSSGSIWALERHRGKCVAGYGRLSPAALLTQRNPTPRPSTDAGRPPMPPV